MDISNSLVPSGLRNPVNPGRQTTAEQLKNQETSTKQNSQGAVPVPVSKQANSANGDLLASRSNEFQQSKLQRLNTLESAPIKTQQAVNLYQQTVEAGRSFAQGELVGIDLFV